MNSSEATREAGAAIGEAIGIFMLHPETFAGSIAQGYTNPLAGYVAGRGGVLKRLQPQVVLLKPSASPDVQAGDCVYREALLQPLAQQVAKQVVIAIPAPLAVQRDDEKVGAVEVS